MSRVTIVHLDVVRLPREDAPVTLLRRVQVPRVVDVDVAQENETLCVVAVVVKQLVEQWGRLHRPLRVGQQQPQVEQGRPEVRLHL